MSPSSWINGAAALVAVGLAAAIGAHQRPGDVRAAAPAVDAVAAVDALVDAGGHTTRVRDFRRIVSGSTVVDRLLVELCEPDRVVAFTAYGADHSPQGYQYAGKARVVSAVDVEKVLALKPDLFLTHSFGSPAKLARLREAGVEVFDLGEARGLQSLLAGARTVATLLGHRERGERFAAGLERRFAHVAAAVPEGARRRGLYLTSYGNQLFGGGTGSSYHDVVTYAGLVDAAGDRFGSWPRYSPEEVLALDPEVIVTKRGMRRALCERAPFTQLAACARGLVIEVADALLDDPGPAMLDAAEAVFAGVYGNARQECPSRGPPAGATL